MTPLEHMARTLDFLDERLGMKRPNPFFNREEDEARREKEARDDAAENLRLKERWDELKNALAARMNLKLPPGMRARGAAEAYLEDADHSIAGFLSETGAS